MSEPSRYERMELVLDWMRHYRRQEWAGGVDEQVDEAITDLADAGRVAVERIGQRVIVTLLPRKE